MKIYCSKNYKTVPVSFFNVRSCVHVITRGSLIGFQ